MQTSEPDYEVHHLPHWTGFPTQKWIDAVPRQEDGIVDAELRPILDELYALFPQPGDKRHVERLVVVNNNRSLARHRHPEYTLVFYIDVGDPMCPILIRDRRVEISPGMAVIMLPGTPHEVPRNLSERPRVSLALRWMKAYKESER